MPAIIEDILCYPVKGLGGFSMSKTQLAARRGIRHDRRFGLAAQQTLDALYESEKWKPWDHCQTLKRNEALAKLFAQTDEEGGDLFLQLSDNDGQRVRGRPAVAAERAQLEEFLRDFLSLPDIYLVDSEHTPLWDDAIHLTLLNTASVEDLSAAATAMGKTTTPLSPTRFRANIVFSDAPAWAEESYTGDFRIGDARLFFGGGVPRCLATTVNPRTATRDVKVPQLIYAYRRHSNMGVFATVAADGDITTGMELLLESA